ncbi:hypothetical protein V3C33_13500 [Micrococcaceae bacterium Sec5.7]
MRSLIRWLAVVAVLTLVCGAVYVTLQQLGRQSANDRPGELVAFALQHPDVLPGPHLDLAQDGPPFVNVYAADGTPLSGTGFLNGRLARLPRGVLDEARTNGMDTVTWQPQEGVRYAVTARSAEDRVIVAGQSLKATEVRAGQTLAYLAAGWLGSVLVVAAAFLLTGAWRFRN